MYGPLHKAKMIDKSQNEEGEPTQPTQSGTTDSDESDTTEGKLSKFAIAKFYSERQAREAVSGLNGLMLHNCRLTFRFRPAKVFDANQVEKVFPLTINQRFGFVSCAKKLVSTWRTALLDTISGARR